MKEDLRTGFIHQALSRPDSPAVIDARSSNITTYTTYSQLWWLACNFSTMLQKQAAFKPGEMVGLFCNSSLEAIVSILGVLMAGGAYLPFDVTQPALRTQQLFQLVKEELRIVVVTQGGRGGGGGSGGRGLLAGRGGGEGGMDALQACLGEEVCRRLFLIVIDEKSKVVEIHPPSSRKQSQRVSFNDSTSSASSPRLASMFSYSSSSSSSSKPTYSSPSSPSPSSPSPSSPSTSPSTPTFTSTAAPPPSSSSLETRTGTLPILVSATKKKSISSPTTVHMSMNPPLAVSPSSSSSSSSRTPTTTTTSSSSSSSSSSSLAYIMMTSGTTGEPKLIRVRHDCVIPNIRQLRQTWSLSASSSLRNTNLNSNSLILRSPPSNIGDVILMTSPLTFDPSVIDIFVSLSSGSSLLIVPNRVRSSPMLLFQAVSDHRVTVMQCTPSVFMRFNQYQRFKILQQLKVLAMGGERFPCLHHIHPDLVHNPSTFSRLSIYSLYGTTELSVWAMLNKVFPPSFQNQETKEVPLSEDMVPLGDAMERTMVVVRDPITQEIVDQGVGELWIERIAVESSFHIAPMPTGDLVRLLPNGNITFEGRKDNQIKINGVRVSPEFVERAILQLPGVVQCSVLHFERAGILRAFIVSQLPFSRKEISRRIVSALHSRLPSVMIPTVYILSRLPVTANGKVDAKWLRVNFVSPCSEELAKKPLPSDVWKVVVNFCQIYLFLEGNVTFPLHLTEEHEKEKEGGSQDQGGEGAEGGKRTHCGTIDRRPTKKARTIHEEVIEAGAFFVQFGSSIDAVRLVDFVCSHFELPLGSNHFDLLQILIHQPLDRFVEKVSQLLFARSSSFSSSSSPQNSTSSNTNIARLLDYGTIEEWKSWHNSGFSQQEKLRYITSSSSPIPSTDLLLSSSLQLKVKWQRYMGKCLDSSPLIVTRRLGQEGGVSQIAYIGSHSSIFAATAMDTGLSLWSLELGGRIDSSAALSQDGRNVLVGCYDGCLYVIDALLGHVVWKFSTGGEIRSSPCVDSKTGEVWIGSYDGSLYCIDIQKEICLKRFELGCLLLSSPVIDTQNRILYVGGHSKFLYAISTAGSESSVLWKFTAGAPIFSTPAIDFETGNVVFGCCDKKLYCVSPSGQQLWVTTLGGPIFSSPSISRFGSSTSSSTFPCVIVGCHDSQVYMISLLDGQILSKLGVGSGVYSSVASIQNTGLVCVCTMEGKVLLVDLQNTSVVAEHQLTAGVFQSSPVVISLATTSASSSTSPLSFAASSSLPSTAPTSFEEFPGSKNAMTSSSPSSCSSSAVASSTALPTPSWLSSLRITVGCRDDNLYCFGLQEEEE